MDRFHLLPDGRVAYRIKQPRRNATHRILEPVELLARIAALIPPPRHPSVRYPESSLRARSFSTFSSRPGASLTRMRSSGERGPCSFALRGCSSVPSSHSVAGTTAAAMAR
ncbi:MAG: transposase [Polyangiales bacterium]